MAELDALTATADERDFETVAQHRARSDRKEPTWQLRRVREALARRRALDYEESLLIFNDVASSVRFIKSLEARAKPATSSK